MIQQSCTTSTSTRLHLCLKATLKPKNGQMKARMIKPCTTPRMSMVHLKDDPRWRIRFVRAENCKLLLCTPVPSSLYMQLVNTLYMPENPLICNEKSSSPQKFAHCDRKIEHRKHTITANNWNRKCGTTPAFGYARCH